MRRKKWWLISGIVVVFFVVVYIGISNYYREHFFYRTSVAGEEVSGWTAEEVRQAAEKRVEQYDLTVQEKNGIQEVIDGKKIDIAYKDEGEIAGLLKKQNGFLWPAMFLEKHDNNLHVKVTYDPDKLSEEIDALGCITDPAPVEPVNAYPKFDGEKYIVEPESLGTRVNPQLLKESAVQAVERLQPELNLEQAGCYQTPRFTAESAEVQAACDALNQYCRANITYIMDPYTEVVDAKVISQWLSFDENLQVYFHEEKVQEYMDAFAAKYETVSMTRPLTTPWGKQTEVTGGTYGWSFDQEAEGRSLLASIKNGEAVVKEIAYEQQGASHEPQDWGKTFIEVDITEQHMWYIADGEVAMESDVVTGLPYARSTPEGVYDILSMSRNTTLVGNILPETGEPEYRTPVSYWMQATLGGVGFHDAVWQPYFGGDLYWYNGSHGCINMPLSAAETLYGLISPGTPVVIHY